MGKIFLFSACDFSSDSFFRFIQQFRGKLLNLWFWIFGVTDFFLSHEEIWLIWIFMVFYGSKRSLWLVRLRIASSRSSWRNRSKIIGFMLQHESNISNLRHVSTSSHSHKFRTFLLCWIKIIPCISNRLTCSHSDSWFSDDYIIGIYCLGGLESFY